MDKYLKISDDVKYALDNHLPIVALEINNYFTCMPYPKNLETALNCEQIIKK